MNAFMDKQTQEKLKRLERLISPKKGKNQNQQQPAIDYKKYKQILFPSSGKKSPKSQNSPKKNQKKDQIINQQVIEKNNPFMKSTQNYQQQDDNQSSKDRFLQKKLDIFQKSQKDNSQTEKNSEANFSPHQVNDSINSSINYEPQKWSQNFFIEQKQHSDFQESAQNSRSQLDFYQQEQKSIQNSKRNLDLYQEQKLFQNTRQQTEKYQEQPIFQRSQQSQSLRTLQTSYDPNSYQEKEIIKDRETLEIEQNIQNIQNQNIQLQLEIKELKRKEKDKRYKLQVVKNEEIHFAERPQPTDFESRWKFIEEQHRLISQQIQQNLNDISLTNHISQQPYYSQFRQSQTENSRISSQDQQYFDNSFNDREISNYRQEIPTDQFQNNQKKESSKRIGGSISDGIQKLRQQIETQRQQPEENTDDLDRKSIDNLSNQIHSFLSKETLQPSQSFLKTKYGSESLFEIQEENSFDSKQNI